jgi:hypothetical protein
MDRRRTCVLCRLYAFLFSSHHHSLILLCHSLTLSMTVQRPLFPADVYSNYSTINLCSVWYPPVRSRIFYSKGHWLPLHGWIGEDLEAAAEL